MAALLAIGAGLACAQTSATTTGATDATAGADATTDVEVDSPARSIPIEARVGDFAVGTSYGCRVRPPRQVQCWGGVYGGIPGNDTAIHDGRLELTFDSAVMSIAAGGGSPCVLLAEGSVRCWGSNLGGALGNGSPDQGSYIREPARVVDLADAVELDGGMGLACARRAQGGVVCWGDAAGNTGHGNGMPFPFPRPVLIEGTGEARQICVGVHHGCFVGSNNRVSCWGDGRGGQTGQDDLTWVPAAREVAGLPAIVSIACGFSETCALDAAHRVWCWGANQSSQLGTTDGTFRARPALVPGLPAVRGVPSVGPTPCVVADTGAVWCWGRNQYGQLGPNATLDANRATPAEVAGVGDVVDVSSGLTFTCARRRDGAVICWGSGEFLSPEQTYRPIPTPTVVFAGS